MAPTIASGWLLLLYIAVAGVTGLLLGWHYVPTAVHAHTSVVDLQSSAAGRFLRATHFCSSHFALALTALHLLSALVLRRAGDAEAAFAARRWLSGLVGLLLLVGLGFSGRILPWDEHGGVSLLVAEGFLRLGDLSPATAILGDAGQHQLQRLLLLHVAGSVVLVACTCWHIELRQRLAELARASTLTRVPLVAVAALVVLGVVAALVPAPLGAPFVDGLSGASVTAEWYLRWVQLLSLRSTLAAQATVVALVALGLATPALARALGERWLRLLWLVALAGLAAISILPHR